MNETEQKEEKDTKPTEEKNTKDEKSQEVPNVVNAQKDAVAKKFEKANSNLTLELGPYTLQKPKQE